jgi:hypothetical protein
MGCGAHVLRHRLDGMRSSLKIGLVAAGYVGAFLVACGIVAVYVAATEGPDRQASSGMYAFGDSLLFLAVFGVAAVPASGAALFFLRSNRPCWLVLRVAAPVIAGTGLAAFVGYVAARTADAASLWHSWSALAELRILAAPLLALAFLLATLFAPGRSSRIALLVATLIEAAVSVSVALMWFGPFGAR